MILNKIKKLYGDIFESYGTLTLKEHIKKINNSNVLKKINLDEKDYFLVSFHRQENVDDPKRLKDFLLLLSAMLKKFNRTIIVSTHPRTEKKISTIKFKNNK